MITTEETTINLIIESFDLSGEVTREKVNSKKKIENNIINYKFKSEIGFCEIEFTADSFKMNRTGESNLKLFFEKNGKGEMDYEAVNFRKKFKVKNGKMELYSGKAIFSYDIYDDKELINSLTIRVMEE